MGKKADTECQAKKSLFFCILTVAQKINFIGPSGFNGSECEANLSIATVFPFLKCHFLPRL